MKTSTLRKLPVPFVVACFLGIGVLSFLLLSPAEEDQQAAQNEVTSTVSSSRLPASSPRYRSKSGVAKLNRSTGTSSQASKQSGSKAQTNQAPLTRREAAKQEVARLKAARKETERQEADRLAQADREATLRQAARSEASRREAARREVARNESSLGDDAVVEKADTTRVAKSTKPLRRDADQIKSATVASTSEPTSSSTYSPENPDPSELLSEVLENETQAVAQLEIDEPDTVMPPGIELEEADLAAPKTNATDLATKPESSQEVDETKTVAAEETPEASSVVNGELESEEPLSIEPSPKRVVRIINPLSNPLPVWFVTQKHKVKLKPGQRYETSTDDELRVRFARGGDLGVDRVVANDGDWVFSVTRQDGWKLSQN